MATSGLELSTLGHRIRHHRTKKGFTLDELGALVGIAGSQLSLIENGKREPKLSLLQAIAMACSTDVADLISGEPPNHRAALAIELDRAQTSPVFRQLGIAPIRVSKSMSDETIEAVPTGTAEAVRAAGGTLLEVARWGLWPAAAPELMSLALYRFEINVRTSAILGLIGVGGVGDLLLEDVVDRLGDRRDRVAGVDEDRAALAMERPAAVVVERDVLPADLAHAMDGRGRASGFEIDDTNDPGGIHARQGGRFAPRLPPFLGRRANGCMMAAMKTRGKRPPPA